MDEKRIGEIVRKVYQKAKRSCVSDAKSALATYVEEEIFKNDKRNISYKTIERTFDKYIDGKKIGSPIAENVDLLCKFLGHEDYSDYIRKRGKRKWVLTITISIALGAVLTAIGILKKMAVANPDINSPQNTERINDPSDPNIDMQLVHKSSCMTWADSLYVAVSCDKGPLSKYGTKVEPMRVSEFKNMQKVEVTAAYDFFTEDGKPLIWYVKNNAGEIEYFTCPGLHPVTDETLKKITEGIIDKYVPTHIDRKDSFMKQ